MLTRPLRSFLHYIVRMATYATASPGPPPTRRADCANKPPRLAKWFTRETRDSACFPQKEAPGRPRGCRLRPGSMIAQTTLLPLLLLGFLPRKSFVLALSRRRRAIGGRNRRIQVGSRRLSERGGVHGHGGWPSFPSNYSSVYVEIQYVQDYAANTV